MSNVPSALTRLIWTLPTRIELKQSSGCRALDEAAIQAVCEWRFSPAQMGSQAVESEIEIPIQFRLN